MPWSSLSVSMGSVFIGPDATGAVISRRSSRSSLADGVIDLQGESVERRMGGKEREMIIGWYWNWPIYFFSSIMFCRGQWRLAVELDRETRTMSRQFGFAMSPIWQIIRPLRTNSQPDRHFYPKVRHRRKEAEPICEWTNFFENVCVPRRSRPRKSGIEWINEIMYHPFGAQRYIRFETRQVMA